MTTTHTTAQADACEILRLTVAWTATLLEESDVPRLRTVAERSEQLVLAMLDRDVVAEPVAFGDEQRDHVGARLARREDSPAFLEPRNRWPRRVVVEDDDRLRRDVPITGDDEDEVFVAAGLVGKLVRRQARCVIAELAFDLGA